MARRPLNPWITNSFLDSCAFDPKYAPEDAAAQEIFELHDKKQLGVQIAHSNQKELEHPNTPEWVKKEAQGLIYTLEVGLTPNERALRQKIHRLITGQGKPEKMAADAQHLFEAQKYGSYLVTVDGRLLKFADELRNLCNLDILLPSEFLALVRSNENPQGQ